MKWSIVQGANPYSNVSKGCDLCITEKLKISDEDNKSVSLNERLKLVSKCQIDKKYILSPQQPR